MNGINLSPWSMSATPLKIAAGEMLSNAPTPSIDKIVDWGSNSDRDCTMCATLGSCARGGCILEWVCACLGQWCELLRNRSCNDRPEHVPDDYPSHSTVRLRQSCHPAEFHGLQHLYGHRTRRELSAAAPLRAVRKFCSNASTSRLRTSSSSASKMERSIGILATRGLRVSSFNNFSVLE